MLLQYLVSRCCLSWLFWYRLSDIDIGLLWWNCLSCLIWFLRMFIVCRCDCRLLWFCCRCVMLLRLVCMFVISCWLLIVDQVQLFSVSVSVVMKLKKVVQCSCVLVGFVNWCIVWWFVKIIFENRLCRKKLFFENVLCGFGSVFLLRLKWCVMCCVVVLLVLFFCSVLVKQKLWKIGLYWNGLFLNSVVRNVCSDGLIVENLSGKFNWFGDSWLLCDSDSCVMLIFFSFLQSFLKCVLNCVMMLCLLLGLQGRVVFYMWLYLCLLLLLKNLVKLVIRLVFVNIMQIGVNIFSFFVSF